MENKNILMIDDNYDSVKIIKTYLETKGYDVFFGYSGQDGLELLKSNKIDLVLLDINMPERDGFEVCDLVKSDESLPNIPVIMLTVRDQINDMYKAARVDADGYLTKPVKLPLLLEKVEKFLA